MVYSMFRELKTSSRCIQSYFLFFLFFTLVLVPAVRGLSLNSRGGAESSSISFVVIEPLGSHPAFQQLITQFNQHPDFDFTVEVELLEGSNKDWYDQLVHRFLAQDSSFDLVSTDIIWIPDFAFEEFLTPLDDILPPKEQNYFLTPPIEASIYDGHIYAVPWFHASGLFFYRTDILEYAASIGLIPANRPPSTWDELYDWTLIMLANQTLVDQFKSSDGVLEGFIWQASSGEDLMCNFLEFLGGTGIFSFLSEEQSFALLDSPPIQEVLSFMKSLITSGISPEEVLTYWSGSSGDIWLAGNAIFHRNWPYYYSFSYDSPNLLNLTTSEPVFAVTTMPHKVGTSSPRTSTLGGWQLGLNRYSLYPEKTKQFMTWLTSSDQQKVFLLSGGFLPSRLSLYSDLDIASSDYAYIQDFLPIFQTAISRPRPTHPRYSEMSVVLQSQIHQFLSGTTSYEQFALTSNGEIDLILKQFELDLLAKLEELSRKTFHLLPLIALISVGVGLPVIRVIVQNFRTYRSLRRQLKL